MPNGKLPIGILYLPAYFPALDLMFSIGGLITLETEGRANWQIVNRNSIFTNSPITGYVWMSDVVRCCPMVPDLFNHYDITPSVMADVSNQ
jgi:hypothetical protein